MSEETMAVRIPDHSDGHFGPERFIDRELSWLAFNQRVLELAEDPDMHLLDRCNFASIFASNLDEFFMVRVASLKRRIATGLAVATPAGLTPQQQLLEMSQSAHQLQERHARLFHDVLEPELAKNGIHIQKWAELSAEEKADFKTYFQNQIFPVLTPLAVDPAHPFPYISGLSLNLAVVLLNPETKAEHFARVKVPPLLPRFVRVPGNTGVADARFVALEEIIGEFLGLLFPGMEVLQHHTFRVTRNEDLEVD
ncbi:MAG: hypothetical protein RLZZ603_282, partial [Actinomycetota bacterium]